MAFAAKLVVFAAASAALMAPAIAQDIATKPASPIQPQSAPARSSDDDIVVDGVRDIDDRSSATRKTLDTSETGSQIVSRQNFELADRVARCSIKTGMRDTRMLHLALDSTINSVQQENAQRWFIQDHAACAADPRLASITGRTTASGKVESSDSDATGPKQGRVGAIRNVQVYYDRGALFVRAIQLFAADAKLTRAQMDAPDVKSRFVMRETPLARFRGPQDRLYLAVAICAVHDQPALAMRLIVNDLPFPTRESIAASIVNRSRACFGDAKKVYFDTTQFRFYLADALYRWIVAVRKVNSLVPSWEDK